jgi:hypothetical protein
MDVADHDAIRLIENLEGQADDPGGDTEDAEEEREADDGHEDPKEDLADGGNVLIRHEEVWMEIGSAQKRPHGKAWQRLFMGPLLV